ncbi:hypothetical protein ACJX0J_011072, partial [Zea mays]
LLCLPQQHVAQGLGPDLLLCASTTTFNSIIYFHHGLGLHTLTQIGLATMQKEDSTKRKPHVRSRMNVWSKSYCFVAQGLGPDLLLCASTTTFKELNNLLIMNVDIGSHAVQGKSKVINAISR